MQGTAAQQRRQKWIGGQARRGAGSCGNACSRRRDQPPGLRSLKTRSSSAPPIMRLQYCHCLQSLRCSPPLFQLCPPACPTTTLLNTLAKHQQAHSPARSLAGALSGTLFGSTLSGRTLSSTTARLTRHAAKVQGGGGDSVHPASPGTSPTPQAGTAGTKGAHRARRKSPGRWRRLAAQSASGRCPLSVRGRECGRRDRRVGPAYFPKGGSGAGRALVRGEARKQAMSRR